MEVARDEGKERRRLGGARRRHRYRARHVRLCKNIFVLVVEIIPAKTVVSLCFGANIRESEPSEKPLDNVALRGLAKFFKESSEEERRHAEKLVEYQNKRGGKLKLQTIVMPLSFSILIIVMPLSFSAFPFHNTRFIHLVSSPSCFFIYVNTSQLFKSVFWHSSISLPFHLLMAIPMAAPFVSTDLNRVLIHQRQGRLKTCLYSFDYEVGYGLISFPDTMFELNLPDSVLLLDRARNSFEVVTRRCDGFVFLCQGWGALGVIYGLVDGGWIQLSYRGNSVFNIRVFSVGFS